MRQFRVRVFLTESYWNDIVITANTWVAAQMIGMGQSPMHKAILLGEAY
jgi:hypothetical protein